MRNSGKVLLIDDHEAALRELSELLCGEGYTVITERNGQEGLRAAARDHPDIVLLDVVMPGMSGVDVCKELKHATATRFTPVVLISGTHDRATRLAGFESGADDFLNKPVDSEELRTRVRSSFASND